MILFANDETPLRQVGFGLVAAASLVGCRLNASAKTGCTTDADCIAGSTCVVNECTPKAQAAAPTGCDLLPTSMNATSPGGSVVPDWRVALVKLPGSPECIYMDKTEVTVADYGAWVDTVPLDATPLAVQWDSRCAVWKQSPSNPAKTSGDTCAAAIPPDQVDPFLPTKPIRCVDWCDADAFCRVARGGHLCYRSVYGGTYQPENQKDEWPAACSNSGATDWPWGNSPDPTRCNLNQSDGGCAIMGFSCGPTPVESFGGCDGPAQIFDLIGNVREWVGICEALNSQSPDGPCMTMGGGYDDALPGCRDYDSIAAKSDRRPDLGFRCCYDLTPAQRQMAGLP